MHETEQRLNHALRSQATGSSSSNSHSSHSSHSSSSRHKQPRMGCEKATRRLRATLLKAERLGVTPGELAELPSVKRILSQRDQSWKLAVLLILMFGGGVIVTLVCTTSRSCPKIDEISLAT